MKLMIVKGDSVLVDRVMEFTEYWWVGWNGPCQPDTLLSVRYLRDLLRELQIEVSGIDQYSYFPSGLYTDVKYISTYNLGRLAKWEGPVIESLNKGCIHYVIPSTTEVLNGC